MKTLFQIKETSASSVRHCCRVLSLIAILMAISASAVADTYYLRYGTSNNPTKAEDYLWSEGSTPVSNVCTWSITPKGSGNCFIYLCNGKDVGSRVNFDNLTFEDPQEVAYWGKRESASYGAYLLISLKTADKFTISWNINTHAVTLGSDPTPTGNAPVVYWAAYPTMGMNTVNMYGHLNSRDCNTITGAGFYWSTSHINVDAAKAAIEAGTDTHIVPATSPDKDHIGSLVAGDIFSAEGAKIGLTESRSIYLVNYAKTAEGGIGISDEVALSYDYCDSMEEGDLTLNNDNVKLPKGAKFKFEAIAHNAGKSPVFEWKDGETVIEGATTNTLDYEMPDENDHTITVTVLGRCGNEDKVSKTATVSLCDAAPSVAFGAEVLTSTTPWVSVPITITATNVTSAEWSVTPEAAELSELTSTDGGYTGTFRAPVAAGVASTDYIIEVKGKNNTCTGSVEAVAEHKITVTKDEDTCNNPE